MASNALVSGSLFNSRSTFTSHILWEGAAMDIWLINNSPTSMKRLMVEIVSLQGFFIG